MPHSLFLGSALATQDRISFRSPQLEDAGTHNNTVSKKDTDDSLQNQRPSSSGHLRRLYGKFKKFILDAFLKRPASSANANLSCNGERRNNSFEFVRAHIYYGMVDMVGSLFGFAVMINSLYVIFVISIFLGVSHLFHYFILICFISQDFGVVFCCIFLWQWKYWG